MTKKGNQRLWSPPLFGTLFLLVLLSLAGCVTVPLQGGGAVSRPVPGGTPAAGRYHRVEKGQTLWRISRMYGLDLQDILNANHITDSVKISVGQMLLIPGDARVTAPRIPSTAGEDEEFVWPLRGKVLVSFGEPVNSAASRGITIAPAGQDTVVASRSGKVVFCADSFLDLGRTLIIEHDGGFWTVYGRNAEIFVKAGDYVAQGCALAKAGQGGRDHATYLYFEIRKGHVPQNPNFYLPR